MRVKESETAREFAKSIASKYSPRSLPFGARRMEESEEDLGNVEVYAYDSNHFHTGITFISFSLTFTVSS